MSVAVHDKAQIALRYWLQGQSCYGAVRAMEFMANITTGLRKDGVTPERSHPIAVTNIIRTMHRSLLDPETTYQAALLHDVVEDKVVTLDEIEEHFGRKVRVSVALLTKKYGSETLNPEDYFAAMTTDPAASVIKGADNVHNVGSMVGVFSPQKQRDYIAYAETLVLPMLKETRRRIPEQEPVYENLKHTLQGLVRMWRGLSQPVAV